ncbi:hypothetical protein D3C86_1458990 [compost metagenome]
MEQGAGTVFASAGGRQTANLRNSLLGEVGRLLLQCFLKTVIGVECGDLQLSLIPIFLDPPRRVISKPIELVRDANGIPQRKDMRHAGLAARGSGAAPHVVDRCLGQADVCLLIEAEGPRVARAHLHQLVGLVAAVLAGADVMQTFGYVPVSRMRQHVGVHGRGVFEHLLQSICRRDGPMAMLGSLDHLGRMDRLHPRIAQLGVAGVFVDGLLAPFVLTEGDPGGAAFFGLLDDEVMHAYGDMGVVCAQQPGAQIRLGGQRGRLQRQAAILADAVALPVFFSACVLFVEQVDEAGAYGAHRILEIFSDIDRIDAIPACP